MIELLLNILTFLILSGDYSSSLNTYISSEYNTEEIEEVEPHRGSGRRR